MNNKHRKFRNLEQRHTRGSIFQLEADLRVLGAWAGFTFAQILQLFHLGNLET